MFYQDDILLDCTCSILKEDEKEESKGVLREMHRGVKVRPYIRTFLETGLEF